LFSLFLAGGFDALEFLAVKKARSRRHWTCVIRPNMAAPPWGAAPRLVDQVLLGWF
jgi:hypothetical protein